MKMGLGKEMDLKETYSSAGYCIIRKALALETLEALRRVVLPIDKGKRKTPLLEEDSIVAAINQAVKPIFSSIQVNVTDLVELYLLVAQASHPVKLGWHKDTKIGDGIHSFQLPLLPGDNIHQLVPGTHGRDINQAEIAARNAGGNSMPNAVRIDLAVGDILLRSPFLFHRGYSLTGVDRLTFVGTYSETA